MIVDPIPPTARPRRVAALLLAVAATLAVATSVRAHAELVSSTPAANAVLATPPAEVAITFSEPVDPETAFVDLLDAEQRRVDGVGSPVVGADGRTLTASLPDLDSGVYTVSYQVVSSVDGHATTGIFAFLVDPDGTEVAPTLPPSSSSPSVDPASIAARWIGLVAALVALGSLLMWANAGRSALEERAPGAPAGPPWRLVAVAGIGSFAGMTAYLVLSARPITDAVGLDGFSLDPAAPFGWTPYAIAMRVVLAGTLLGGIAAGVRAVAAGAEERASDRWLVPGAALLFAIALAGMSTVGHAASNGGALGAALDWVHLVAVASWLGAIPAGFLLARRARGPVGSVRSAAWAILRRHGRVALVAAPVVALTGIANSPLVLGSSRDLVATDYGNLVLAKAMLLAVAVGIGAVNHVGLRGRRRRVMAGLVAVELAVAVLAIGVAATMVTIQPAAGRQGVLLSTPVNPAHLFGTAGASSVHLTVNLPSPGNQLYQVSIADLETGAPGGDVQLVFMELTPPGSSGLPASGRIELAPTDTPGLYEASGAYTSIEGDWAIELTVRRVGQLDEAVAFVVPVISPGAPEIGPPPNTGITVPGPLGALWPILPPGPLAWLIVAAGLLGLALIGRSRAPQLVRWTGGGALLGLVLVIGAAAGSRGLVTAATAPPAGLAPLSVPSDAETLARGEALYLANCAACHGRDGTGGGPVRTLPPAGPMADPVRGLSAAELEYRIADGLPGTPMPAFAGALTQDERIALVGYLRDRWIDE